jgi:hypothetical protein
MSSDKILFYKQIPKIIKDMESKGEEIKEGVYTINIKIGEEDMDVRYIRMPEYDGIINEDDELIYVFSGFDLTLIEEEDNE